MKLFIYKLHTAQYHESSSLLFLSCFTSQLHLTFYLFLNFINVFITLLPCVTSCLPLQLCFLLHLTLILLSSTLFFLLLSSLFSPLLSFPLLSSSLVSSPLLSLFPSSPLLSLFLSSPLFSLLSLKGIAWFCNKPLQGGNSDLCFITQPHLWLSPYSTHTLFCFCSVQWHTLVERCVPFSWRSFHCDCLWAGELRLKLICSVMEHCVCVCVFWMCHIMFCVYCFIGDTHFSESLFIL